MEVKLVIASGKHAGKEYPMPGTKLMIGQGEACQLRLAGEDVERQHCVIFTQEGQLLIRDFNSRAGTFVNNEKVTGQQDLKTGDRVRVGRLEFTVQINVDVGGKKKPKVHSIKEAAARMVQSAAVEDLDISQWLTETDHTPTMMDTKGLQVRHGDENQAPQQQQKPAHKSGGLFGKEEEAKQTTASSKEAAAELLKQMFGGKPMPGRRPGS